MPRLSDAEERLAKMSLSLAAATDPASTVESRAEIRRRHGIRSIISLPAEVPVRQDGASESALPDDWHDGSPKPCPGSGRPAFISHAGQCDDRGQMLYRASCKSCGDPFPPGDLPEHTFVPRREGEIEVSWSGKHVHAIDDSVTRLSAILEEIPSDELGPSARHLLTRALDEIRRHEASVAADKSRIQSTLISVVSEYLDSPASGWHPSGTTTSLGLAHEIAIRGARELATAWMRLPARKEWDAEAHDRGDTSEADGYESADYVDGWNEALDSISAASAVELDEIDASRATRARLEAWAVELEKLGQESIGRRVAEDLRLRVAGTSAVLCAPPVDDGAELRRVRQIILHLHGRHRHGEWGDPLDGCIAALGRTIKLAGHE